MKYNNIYIPCISQLILVQGGVSISVYSGSNRLSRNCIHNYAYVDQVLSPCATTINRQYVLSECPIQIMFETDLNIMLTEQYLCYFCSRSN